MTRGGPLIIIAFLVPLTLDVGPSPVFLSRILIVRKILLLLYSKIKNANSQYHIRISNINIQYIKYEYIYKYIFLYRIYFMFIMYLCYHMIRLILIGTLGPIYTSSTSIFILILLLLETLQYEYAAMNVLH